MGDTSLENWENRLRASAGEMTYPSTPDIARQARHRLEEARMPHANFPRRAAWAGVILVILLLLTILLVPPVRAAVLDFLQIGAVRIFLVKPTPTATPTSAPSTPTLAMAEETSLPTAKPTPTPIYLASLLDLQGETTLDQALDHSPFIPSLPHYPPDLGKPNRVFLQEDGMLFLVWTDPMQPDVVRLSLNIIAPGSWAATKMMPDVIQQTTVNAQEALWAEGPYMMWLTSGKSDLRRLINGHVLIWEEAGLTYRLESSLSMAETVKIAESLKPINQ